MAHAWLLVASALLDMGYENISELSDAVNRYIETGSALDSESQSLQEKAAWRLKEHRDADDVVNIGLQLFRKGFA